MNIAQISAAQSIKCDVSREEISWAQTKPELYLIWSFDEFKDVNFKWGVISTGQQCMQVRNRGRDTLSVNYIVQVSADKNEKRCKTPGLVSRKEVILCMHYSQLLCITNLNMKENLIIPI